MAVLKITKDGNFKIQFNKTTEKFEVLHYEGVVDTSWTMKGARNKMRKLQVLENPFYELMKKVVDNE